MKKRVLFWFILSGGFFSVFLIFTLSVCFIDIQAIGPKDSTIGLATFNGFVFRLIGVHLIWYHITDWLGIIAIVTAFVFAVQGLLQLFKKRSIKKINVSLFLLGGFYIIVLIFYIIFECFVINYRPILMNGFLEASYPSSHTMIVVCIMATAIIVVRRRNTSSIFKKIFQCFAILLIFITIIGRLISGVHWITDIIGGIVLGTALITLFYAFLRYFEEKHNY